MLFCCKIAVLKMPMQWKRLQLTSSADATTGVFISAHFAPNLDSHILEYWGYSRMSEKLT